MPGWVNGMRILLFIILTMTACSGFLDPLVSSDERAAPSPATTINEHEVSTTQPSLEIPPTPPPTVTPKSSGPTVPPGGSAHFRIEQRSHSDEAAMQGLALVLHRAELSATELSLRVGFENITDQAFSLIGRFDKSNVVLIDAAGQAYEPLRISENLQQIDPPDGFLPGEANVGAIIFPRSGGSEPYELRLSRFDPIQFRLDTPLPAEALVKVAPGAYPLDVRLHSTDEALAGLELQVHSVQVTIDDLTFLVGLVNTSAQSYRLSPGFTGQQVTLQDVENTRYQPIRMSEALRDFLVGENDWEPGQEQRGTLTFPLSETMSEVRLIFPRYGTLTIRFDETGVAEIYLASIFSDKAPARVLAVRLIPWLPTRQ